MTTALVLATLLLLLILRMPVAVAMIASASLGFALLGSIANMLSYWKTAGFWLFSSYDLSVVPLFILMGQCAARSGLSHSLFRAARAVIGHKRGGLAMAALAGCAGFAAMCGSSLATAATMGRIALPELRAHAYEGGFAAATLAIGGTLGILIPPSIVLVIFAIITEANIAKLFAAALVPGLLAAALYMTTAALYARKNPHNAPQAPHASRAEQRQALLQVLPAFAVIALVIGGLYAGWTTPSEAAALGTSAVFCHFFATAYRKKTRRALTADLLAILSETACASAMIFFILLAADLLSAFLAFAGLPQALAAALESNTLSPYSLLLLTMLVLVLLGCFLDSLSIVVLTMPLLWPVLSGLDFGMPAEHFQLWFGILALILVEIGLITPPVGLNCLIIHRIAQTVPLQRIFRASLPFLSADLLRIALLLLFPQLVLFLPTLLGL